MHHLLLQGPHGRQDPSIFAECRKICVLEFLEAMLDRQMLTLLMRTFRKTILDSNYGALTFVLMGSPKRMGTCPTCYMRSFGGAFTRDGTTRVHLWARPSSRFLPRFNQRPYYDLPRPPCGHQPGWINSQHLHQGQSRLIVACGAWIDALATVATGNCQPCQLLMLRTPMKSTMQMNYLIRGIGMCVGLVNKHLYGRIVGLLYECKV